MFHGFDGKMISPDILARKTQVYTSLVTFFYYFSWTYCITYIIIILLLYMTIIMINYYYDYDCY